MLSINTKLEILENQCINKVNVLDLDDDKKVAQQQMLQLQQNPPPSLMSGNNQWQNCRRLIYVPRSAQKGYSVGHWPIPEGYWPDLGSATLVCLFS